MTSREDRNPRVHFVLEQHLGLGTFAANLSEILEGAPGVDLAWSDIIYRPSGHWSGRVPLLSRWAGPLAGRSEVRTALRSRADVCVFNTQVPAALAGHHRRTSPYVVMTDVTPTQYDDMAADYGHEVDTNPLLRRWKQRVNEQVFRQAAACVGWSSWAANSIVADYGVRPDRVEVIAPGVDLDRWRPRPASGAELPRVLFVGGDFVRKGGEDLLAAFAGLEGRAELVVVTKSPVPARSGLTVVDDLSPNDPRLVDLFQTSDVFVFPTRAETFGMAAVEASAVGLPVVATAVGGLTDIVSDGMTGLTVEPRNPVALGRALHRLVDDAGLRVRLGRAARAKAELSFDARANANRLLDLACSRLQPMGTG